MKKFTIQSILTTLLVLLLSVGSARACNLSDLTFLGVTGTGPYVISLRLCVGMGLTGSTKGGDQSTRSIFFGFYDAAPPGFTVNSFTPANLVGPMGCSMPGTNFGPDPYFGLQGEVIYTDPAYFGDPFCTARPYGCVNSTAACGIAQAFCRTLTFTVNQIPDSVRVFGVEGGGNPVGGCYPNPDMVVSFPPLPVVWGEIYGIRSTAGIELKWSTVLEINTDFFIIERSNDGVTFESIGEVAATGNSNSLVRYTFFDNAPSPGENQYRIVQVDRIGEVNESQTIEINYFKPETMTWGGVGPNPASGTLEAKVYVPQAGALDVLVLDMGGRRVMEIAEDAKLGGNTFRLDVAELRSGTYFLRIEGSQGSLTKKFVKL